MVVQHALRPYATAGVVLVGAGMIAVSPAIGPPSALRDVALTAGGSPYAELFTDTVANLHTIVSGADGPAITQVLGDLFTNPLGVISALTNLTPDVTTNLASLPGQISVQLPPGLELGIAQLGAEAATLNAVNGVAGQLTSDPSTALTTLLNAPAEILNAYLNGQDNISLLGGIVTIPAFNGVLAPEQSLSVDLNLTDLINALGLGKLNLSSLDLTSLLNQIGLGNLNLGSLFSDLGLSGKGLGTLLGDPSLGTLLNDLGLGNLGLGSLSLTSVLSDLGLSTNVNLSSLSLDTVLGAFGINTNLPILNEGVGTVLSPLLSDFPNVLGSLNSTLDTLLSPLAGLTAILSAAGLNVSSLLTPANLVTALNNLTVGDLLGVPSASDTVSSLLGALGVSVPSNLTIGTVLSDLGFSSSTGQLTLNGLLGDLGLANLNVGSLLDTVNLNGLLGDLGLSTLPLNLSNLGDLTNLSLGGLLGDLGLGNLATVTVDPLGGIITELVDTVPQQILTALGG